MKVQFLKDNRQKKFAVIPYSDFVKLVELAADEEDYRKALKVLQDEDDRIVDYDSGRILSPKSTLALRSALSQSRRKKSPANSKRAVGRSLGNR